MNNYNPNGWRPKPTQPSAPTQAKLDLRAKFQMPAQPINVEKIADLAKKRSVASMEEITEIISSESGVTQRLISMAYPKRDARLGATVQMATSRLGVNRVIVVMVGDLLSKAVMETFETMVQMPLEVDAAEAALSDHGYLTSSVRFSGKTNGLVTLAFSPHFSLILAAQLLGGDMDTEYTSEAINDVIGELANIVTGNLQSKLCDAGLTSSVGLPEVAFQRKLPEEAVPGGSKDQFFFKHATYSVAVCLSIDPSPQAIQPPAAGPPRAPTTYGNTWRANRP